MICSARSLSWDLVSRISFTPPATAGGTDKSSSTVRDLDGFGQRAQTEHRDHPAQRSWRQNHERIAPANQVDEARNQFDRNNRQQKSQTRLDRQRRAEVLRIAQLSNAG